MQILFVSNNFPRDLHIQVHGFFKRMGMFIDALKGIAQLDMLFYVDPDTEMSPSAIAAFERAFTRHWNADIRLYLCPRFQHKRELPKWQRYGAEVVSFFRQASYIGTSGPQQVRAFEDCLGRKPDAIFAHRLASMCPPLLTREPLPPIFLDLDDVRARGILA